MNQPITIESTTANSESIARPVGVIGGGRFGTTIARLLSANSNVLIYVRKENIAREINTQHTHFGYPLSPNILATTEITRIADQCRVIFPVVPSKNFRDMMRQLAPHLHPYHFLIHGTKGLDIIGGEEDIMKMNISREDVWTMSEVIRQESVVRRIGALGGPNLSKEIMEGQPAATVLASEFDEVFQVGQQLLSSERFFVFGSEDVLGTELAGALKNVIAIGSGIATGKGYGKNVQGLLIARGIREMITLGQAVGATSRSFLGTAGIGDLVATATSADSRNFSLGFRIAQGDTLERVLASSEEVAEGVRTLKIVQQLAKHYHIRIPIMQMIYSIVFEELSIDKAIYFLMKYPYSQDVDFL